MLKGLWNYAIKTDDLQKSADFYVRQMGAQIRLQGEILGSQYVLIRMGETRVILFDRAPHERELGLNLPPGLLHVVYEVDDFEAQIERLRQAGVTFLMEPQRLEGEFGIRMIAFFESPEGVRTEVMQVIENSGKA